MTEREQLSAGTEGGRLAGWISGQGSPVLLLHGGPGLSYEYLDPLADDLGEGFHIAAYQQRGLEPSTLDGPFTVAQAIADAIAVLDALDWRQALIVGHSWGGYLALRLAAAHPERTLGALAVDPLGIVGDGGMAAFGAEMNARTPAADRERGRMLDERAMAGEGKPGDALEGLAIVWPAYFADPETAPPMPALSFSLEAYSGIMSDLVATETDATQRLAQGDVRYGVIAGAASPIPWGQAARASVEVSPTAFLTVVPGAGHLPWIEVPGAVRAALLRLVP
jgi:proline iminopeptidase